MFSSLLPSRILLQWARGCNLFHQWLHHRHLSSKSNIATKFNHLSSSGANYLIIKEPKRFLFSNTLAKSHFSSLGSSQANNKNVATVDQLSALITESLQMCHKLINLLGSQDAQHLSVNQRNPLLLGLNSLNEEFTELRSLLLQEASNECGDVTLNENNADNFKKASSVNLTQLVEEELAELINRLKTLQGMTLQLLAQDEFDLVDEFIIELEQAVGGQESMLFTKEMTHLYLMLAEKNGWQASLINVDAEDTEGYRSASIKLQTPGIFKLMRHEGGVHRVQRIPKTERSGRIHTSTIAVRVVPLFRQQLLNLTKQDLRVETVRSQGPGGQHVNKTESCVRITHLPTGVVVECQEQRNQEMNRSIAMDKLKIELSRRRMDEIRQKEMKLKRSQVTGIERSDKIRTYNFPQDRITDHRLHVDLYNLKGFMRAECSNVLLEWLSQLGQTHQQKQQEAIKESYGL